MTTFDDLERAFERARRLGARGDAEAVVAKLLIDNAPLEEVIAAIPPPKEDFVARAHALGAQGGAVRRVVKLLKQGAPYELVMEALKKDAGPHPRYGYIRRRSKDG